MTPEAFWQRVEKTSTCWLWQGRSHKHGYGLITEGRRPNRKDKLAHRKSWEMHNGPIPKGRSVLHKCDTPACIRPDHLFLGTQQDNLADMRAKGRQAVGEQARSAKLTAKQVVEIRERYAVGELQKSLAEAFGMTQTGISRIVLRKTWKHVL